MKTQVTDTSIAAYHNHGSLSAQQRNLILQFISDKGGDWSIGEVAAELELQKSTVSARINELLNDTCQLVKFPKRKDRISRITIRPVGLPMGRGSCLGVGNNALLKFV